MLCQLNNVRQVTLNLFQGLINEGMLKQVQHEAASIVR